MAAKKQNTGVRSKKSGVKVWHITDFDVLFKLADDVRKNKRGPLSFTKSPVSLSGQSKPCEVHHYERLRDLKARAERHLLRSVFEDLKSWSAHKPQNQQGYLVTHAGRPADPAYIAAQIDNIDKNELKKAMRILGEIGLIERITLNGQFSAKNEEPPETGGNDTDNSADLKKDEGKAQAAPEKRKASIGLSADEDQEKVIGKGKNKPPQAPTTTPEADKPTESDLRGETTPYGSDSLSGAVYTRGDIHYGGRIYRALKLKHPEDSPEAYREITSFASKWHKCKEKLTGLDPPEINQLGIRGVRQAEKIAKQKGNRAAKWNDFMDKVTDAIVYDNQLEDDDDADPVTEISGGNIVIHDGKDKLKKSNLDEFVSIKTVPDRFALHQNYPNPFNPITAISYQLPEACNVSLTIYNNNGQEIRSLVNKFQSAGYYTIQWNGRDELANELVAGIYFYEFRAGKFKQVRKALLLK